MINQPVSAERCVAPTQVWTRLATDCRARAIRLTAQLAFNLVLGQSDLLVEEPNHVEQTRHAQNPA